MSRFFEILRRDWPIPRQSAGASTLAQPARLADWLDQLPLANAEVSQRQLHKALGDLGEMRLEPAQRLASLEQMRAPVATVNAAIERQILGMSFPLPPAKARVAALARDTDHLLAHGYRQVIVDWCAPSGKVPFLRGKYIALALERALMHLAAVIEQGYVVYARAPARAWETLNALIGFARELGLDQRAVPDPLLDNATATALARYAQAAILAASNPYRFNQREVADAARVAQVLARSVQVRSGARALEIDLTLDDAPVGMPGEERAAVGRGFALDFGPVEAALAEALARAGDRERSITFGRSALSIAVPQSLVAKIADYWSHTSQRITQRLPAGYMLDTVIGFSAVATALGSALEFTDLVIGGESQSNALGDSGGAWANGDPNRVDIVRATVNDQSLRGYRLTWAPGDAVRVKVGEVIALALGDVESTRRDWMVGVVRWMRIAADGHVDGGIELIARRARQGSLRALDGPGRGRPPLRALWLDLPSDDLRGDSAGRVLVSNSIDRGATAFELARAPELHAGGEHAELVELHDWTRSDLASGFVLLSPRVASNAAVHG